MLGKRKLTKNSVDQVAEALELQRSERKYFELLVNIDKAKTVQQREDFLKLALKYCQSQNVHQIKNSFVFLSNHNSMKILTHLIMKDIDQRTESIAQNLGLVPSIVESVLQNMSEIGLACQNPETDQWSTTTERFEIPDEGGNLALQAFHLRTLEESKSAVALDPQKRHLESITLTLDEDQYLDCVQEIKDFTSSLLQRFATTEGNGRRIFQLNLQCLPVSTELIRSEKFNVERALEQENSDNKMKEGFL